MTDIQGNNQSISAASAGAIQNTQKAVPTSPWEEELPPEEPKEQIIGTLDKNSDSGGASFAVPEKVEDKVLPTYKVPDNQPSPNLQIQAPSNQTQPSSVPTQAAVPPVQPQTAAKVAPPANQSTQPQNVRSMSNDVAVKNVNPGLAFSDNEQNYDVNAMLKSFGKPAPANQNIQPTQSQTADPVTAPVQPVNSAPAPSGSLVSNLFKRNSNNSLTVAQSSTQAAPINSFQSNQKPKLAILKHPVVSVLITVFFFITSLILLTEYGVISIGVEKIYGAIGLQTLWRGLPISTEKAIAYAAVQMKNNPNMQASGTMTITIDKTIKSSITNPLVSYGVGDKNKHDVAVTNRTLAKTTANDYYYYDSSSSDSSNTADSTDNSSDSSSSSSNSSSSSSSSSSSGTSSSSSDQSYSGTNGSTSSDSSASSSSTNSNSGTSTSSNSNENQTNNIVELPVNVNLTSGANGIRSDLTINNNGTKTVSLINSNGNLYVKSPSDIKFDKNSSPDKWIVYNIEKTKNNPVWGSVFSTSTATGFSAKGTRSGNEKIGNGRAYHYKIDSLEIGKSLEPIGITSDMVQTVSGDIWIGIHDKMIKKVSLKITTPISSSVSMIQIDLTFSPSATANQVNEPESSETVAPAGSAAETLTGDAKRKDDVNNILAALKKYKDANGSYPLSPSLLKLSDSGNIIEKALVPAYLSALPVDPNTGNGWYYAYKSNDGTNCSVSARLEDQMDAEATMSGNIPLYLKYNSN